MRRLVTLVLMAGVVAAGPMPIGAQPAVRMPMPPLPVPPLPRELMPAYLARLTISGDPKMTGVFETCMDPAGTSKAEHVRAKARPVGAPSPPTGCNSTVEFRPGGVIHRQLVCDQAKGAKGSFRLVSVGTPNDLRVHIERYSSDPATGTPKTTVADSHVVRLGPCPADLKPGQMRRVGGPIIEPGEAARLLESDRGARP